MPVAARAMAMAGVAMPVAAAAMPVAAAAMTMAAPSTAMAAAATPLAALAMPMAAPATLMAAVSMPVAGAATPTAGAPGALADLFSEIDGPPIVICLRRSIPFSRPSTQPGLGPRPSRGRLVRRSTPISTITRSEALSNDARCIEGIQNDLTGTPSLFLSGTPYTPTALIAYLQAHIDAGVALTRAEDTLHLEVQAYKQLTQQVTKVVRALRVWVINTYGEQSPVLADFGFTVAVPAPLTPEQKVAKAAKAEATRVARGTKGPKARLAIKGDVTGVTVTPIEEVPAPQAPTQTSKPATPAK